MPELAVVEVSGSIPYAVVTVFELLSDYSRVNSVIDGLEALSPLDQNCGVGARFTARFRIAGRSHTLELRLEEARRAELVTWTGLGGSDRSVAFHLAAAGEKTSLRIVTRYPPAAGLAGFLARPVVASTVREHAERTLGLLREGGWRL